MNECRWSWSVLRICEDLKSSKTKSTEANRREEKKAIITEYNVEKP